MLATILDQLTDLAVPVILPLHPRTATRAESFGLRPKLDRLRVVEPLGYREFLGLANTSGLLVSDSGGVQEEASILKRPVILVRRSTERPEVQGTFARRVLPGPLIGCVARELWTDLDYIHETLAATPCPYGDGTASRRTVDAIDRMLETIAA